MYKIGVIGAGKVGVTLVNYFKSKNSMYIFTGFYSKNIHTAKYAANITNTFVYNTLNEIISNNDIIFITVPDDSIKIVWESIKKLNYKNKIYCHCSGSLSSEIFSEVSNLQSYGVSLHPLVAVNSKEESYKTFDKVFFTLEGDTYAIKILENLLLISNNKYKILNNTNKTKYHLAAVMISNLVIGLGNSAVELLKDYGFTQEEAINALENLAKNNINNFFENGSVSALTGPIERNDKDTIKRHLSSIENNLLTKNIYKYLSLNILEIAKIKNKDRDYKNLEILLNKE